jgi:putative adenylate-forming enzyme
VGAEFVIGPVVFARMNHSLNRLWAFATSAIQFKRLAKSLDLTGLRAWQHEQRKKLFDDLAAKSPHYKKLWAGVPELNRTAPILSKTDWIAQFNESNTAGLNWAECMNFALESERSRDFSRLFKGNVVGLSSGTTQTRGLFVTNSIEQARYFGVLMSKISHFFDPPGPKNLALFLRANSAVFENPKFLPLRMKFFDTFRPFDELLAELEALNPEVLIAPASVLMAITDRIGRRIQPETIVSVAEVLDPANRAKLEGFWGRPVFEVYQATEGLLGQSCSRGVMHLNEDIFVIEQESLDDRRFVPVVTDLFRRIQPVVRLRVDDVILKRAQPCACGSPLIAVEQIEGRLGDVFLLGDNRQPLFADTLSRWMIQESWPADFELVQQSKSQFELCLMPCDKNLAEALQQSLGQFLSHRSGQPIRVETKNEVLKVGPTKRRRFRRSF